MLSFELCILLQLPLAVGLLRRRPVERVVVLRCFFPGLPERAKLLVPLEDVVHFAPEIVPGDVIIDIRQFPDAEEGARMGYTENEDCGGQERLHWVGLGCLYYRMRENQ